MARADRARPDRRGAAVPQRPTRSRVERSRRGRRLRRRTSSPTALAELDFEYAPGARGLQLKRVAGGIALATDPIAEEAARRLLAKPRTPPLTPAQAETLAIVAYLQPVSRPEITRIRGVAADSATGDAARARLHRGGRALAVRRGPVPHDGALPQALRPRLAEGAAERRASGTRRPRRRPSCATACCAPASSARALPTAEHAG